MGRPGQSGSAATIDPMKLLRQYWRWLGASVVLGIGVGVATYLALRMAMPRFDSIVTFEVSPPPDDPFKSEIRSVGAGGEQEMEQYMETQVFVMRSEKILKRLVEDLDVQQTGWARPYNRPGGFDVAAAFDEIEEIVGARRVPKTQIMTFRVRTRLPNDAYVIASTASDIYLADVTARERGVHLDLKQQLEASLAQLRANVQRVDRERESLLGRNTITALQETNSVQLAAVRALQPEIVDTRADLAQYRELYKNYQEMLAEPGGAVFPEQIREQVERDPVVLDSDRDLAGMKAQLRGQEENGMANSTLAKRLRREISARVAERQAFIDEQLPGAFAAQLEQIKDQIDALVAEEADQQAKIEAAEATLTQTAMTLQQYDDLTAEREQLQDRILKREEGIANIDALINRPIRVTLLDSARIPDILAFPKPLPILGLAIVLVPALIGSLIVLREVREQRVRGPQDVALIPRVRVLGVVPDISMDPSNPEHVELASREAPGGVLAETIRQLRTSLIKDCRAHGHRSILVFAGMPSSGATTLVTNLAVSLAETETHVLVIDANVRRPRASTLLGAAREPGLTDVLAGRSSLGQAVQSTDDSNLSVLAAGARDPKVFERFPSRDMGELIGQAIEAYDLVLIDSPPAVVSSDALAIAQHCDASMLVARAYAEKRGLVARLRGQFSDTHATFMGVVVNGVKASAGGYFKRNFQVTHEYGREAIPAPEPELTDMELSTNGLPAKGSEETI